MLGTWGLLHSSPPIPEKHGPCSHGAYRLVEEIAIKESQNKWKIIGKIKNFERDLYVHFANQRTWKYFPEKMTTELQKQ